ncbi:MAG: hypothetical protein RIS45_1263 [Planctomycetota bacterium]|jgi:hypothetical protein
MSELKAGETVVLTAGDYSDYRILGTVKVLRDFDPDALAEQWTAEQRAGADPWAWVSSRDWYAWLLTAGYAEEAPVGEHRLSVFS